MSSIYDLMEQVRQHPKFVAGTLFTTDDLDVSDFSLEVQESIDGRAVESAMVEAGWFIIDRQGEGRERELGLR